MSRIAISVDSRGLFVGSGATHGVGCAGRRAGRRHAARCQRPDRLRRARRVEPTRRGESSMAPHAVACGGGDAASDTAESCGGCVREAPGVARRGRLTLVSSRPPSNRACGSPAHGSPTSFAAGVRRSPPGPVGSGCDDGSVEADQAVAVGLLEDPAAVVCAALVAFADEQGEAIERVGRDQVEVLGGVSVAEVARPAAQEGVDLPRDVFDGKSSRWRVVICLTQSRACCIARREGQRARKLMCLACDPRTRTQR